MTTRDRIQAELKAAGVLIQSNVRWGTKRMESGETWTEWVSFPRSMLGNLDLDPDWVSDLFTQHDGGPGQEFAKRACVRESRSRVLVTQHCGLDI